MSLVVLAIRLALFFIVTHTHTHTHTHTRTRTQMYINGVNVCANLGVEVSKKMCHQSTAKTLAQKNQKKKKEEEEKVNPIELPLALALHLIPGG